MYNWFTSDTTTAEETRPGPEEISKTVPARQGSILIFCNLV